MLWQIWRWLVQFFGRLFSIGTPPQLSPYAGEGATLTGASRFCTFTFRRGAQLDLGRSEEAIASYDQAPEIKPDFHEAWSNCSCMLSNNFEQHEEAGWYTCGQLSPRWTSSP